jgi:hypothetical protein
MRNSIIIKAVFLFSIIFFLSVNRVFAQIADNYPNDVNIGNDANVIFAEMFEQGSTTTLLAGYTNVTNSSNISFDASVPPGSLGMQSCKLTSYHTPSNLNATEMRKRFPIGVNDSVFVRFYVKYNNDHTHHHSGIWLHGSDPSHPCFPCIYPGRIGLPPGGDSAFSLGAELRGSVMTAQTNSRFGMYNYWTDMHPNSSDVYYGNEFINGNPNSTINTTEWNCIEVMLKLNNPVTDSSGEAKLWINGELIEYYGKGFPDGNWNELTFTQGNGQPFEGFKWRTSNAVLFNSIWIKNYSATGSSTEANDILYDHIVVAKNYIGPIYNPISTGIESDDRKAKLAVYPNPADDIIHFSNPVKSLAVFNCYGQKVIEQADTEKFSTAGLAEGIYVLKTEIGFNKVVVRH